MLECVNGTAHPLATWSWGAPVLQLPSAGNRLPWLPKSNVLSRKMGVAGPWQHEAAGLTSLPTTRTDWLWLCVRAPRATSPQVQRSTPVVLATEKPQKDLRPGL